jgi:ribonuclease HI/probable phosphoglycerate mutase
VARPTRDDVVQAIEEVESLSSTLARFPGLRRGDLIDILRGGRRKKADEAEPPAQRSPLRSGLAPRSAPAPLSGAQPTKRDRLPVPANEDEADQRRRAQESARRAAHPKKKRQIEPGMRLILNSDGASRGNPGPASIGIVLTQPDGTIVDTIARYIGRTTNNHAEYEAVRVGLLRAKELGARAVHVRADSELAIRQLTGVYRVKNEQLKSIFDEIKRLSDDFPQGVSFEHVGRELNQKADALANEALDHPRR